MLQVLDMGQNLVRLCKTLNSPNLPNIDKCALLEQLVDVICFMPEAVNEIADFKNTIIGTDILFSGPAENGEGMGNKMAEIAKQFEEAAFELMNDLKMRGLYCDSFLNYKYHTHRYDQTIILASKQRRLC